MNTFNSKFQIFMNQNFNAVPLLNWLIKYMSSLETKRTNMNYIYKM
jgi:hypothetical protein